MKARRGQAQAWVSEYSNFVGADCLEWPFAKSKKGYGICRHKGSVIHAHRVVCLLAHGEPPAGFTDAAHSCGNKLCCNPAPLRHASTLDNQREKIAHGTVPRGRVHWNYKHGRRVGS